MSKYVINQGCCMCGKHEVGLVTMTVGKTKHHLCYDCMTKFALDIADYAIMNLSNEISEYGYKLTLEMKNGEQ